MAKAKEGKTRINVTLSNDLLEQVDQIAKSYGCTRASMCAFFIGQGCTSTIKAYKAFERVFEREIDDAVGKVQD